MQSVNCVVIGDGAVGKTCMLISYTSNGFPSEYVPTVFENYAATAMVDNHFVNLSLWDTAGQEDFNKLRPMSYTQAEVFIVCYSVVEPSSLRNIKKIWHPEIKHHAGGTPYLFVGTKCDLRDDTATLEKLERLGEKPLIFEDGAKLAKELQAVKCMECSALTQEGLKEVFEEAMRCSMRSGAKTGSAGCCQLL